MEDANEIGELFIKFSEAREVAEKENGIITTSLADAYLALTGTPLPSEYIGQPMRSLNGSNFDLYNLRLARSKDSS